MKFDSNLAWKDAAASVAANRELLLALAGVFYLLPSLVLGLLYPQPEIEPGATQEAVMAVMAGYYESTLPVMLPLVLFQAAGTLSLLTLLTDWTRPTVAEAIKLGLTGIIPYLLAQLLLGVGIGLVGGLIFALGTATGSPVLAAISLAVVGVLMAYAMIKTSLTAPAIVVEGLRNPVEVLKRSWRLTKGNSVRIGLFFALIAVVFFVIAGVATSLLGIVLKLVIGGEATQLFVLVLSSMFNALLALYFVAIIAAIHRQLAGPDAGSISQTFD